MQLHIAGALEFLVNDVVHTAAGIDETGGDDSEAAAFLGVSGRTEEPLWRIQSDGIYASGEGATAGWHGEVIGARQAGDAVQQDNHILTTLDQPFRPLERYLCHPGMVFNGLIEGRANHLAMHGPLHVRHFLRPFTNEDDHDVDVFVVCGDPVGNGLQQHGLARLGWRDNEPPLAPTDGSNEIQQPGRKVCWRGLQVDHHLGEYGGKVLEVRALAGYFWIESVHRLNSKQPVVFFTLFGRADLPGDHVPGAQPKATHLRLRDVDVVQAGPEGIAPQETVAFVYDLKDATAEDVALLLTVRLEQTEDQFVLFEGADTGYAQVFRNIQQVFARF